MSNRDDELCKPSVEERCSVRFDPPEPQCPHCTSTELEPSESHDDIGCRDCKRWRSAKYGGCNCPGCLEYFDIRPEFRCPFCADDYRECSCLRPKPNLRVPSLAWLLGDRGPGDDAMAGFAAAITAASSVKNIDPWASGFKGISGVDVGGPVITTPFPKTAAAASALGLGKCGRVWSYENIRKAMREGVTIDWAAVAIVVEGLPLFEPAEVAAWKPDVETLGPMIRGYRDGDRVVFEHPTKPPYFHRCW